MKTALCDLLGIEHPIVAAPMGPDLTGPELVAAVSNAGGLPRIPADECEKLHLFDRKLNARLPRERPPVRPTSADPAGGTPAARSR